MLPKCVIECVQKCKIKSEAKSEAKSEDKDKTMEQDNLDKLEAILTSKGIDEKGIEELLFSYW